MTVVRGFFVSIPSSSGHQFTARPFGRFHGAQSMVSIPSSSGHQFTDRATTAARKKAALVSIPSSSGHQFTVCQCSNHPLSISGFQSLLHQGISLLQRARLWPRASISPFQSLLHQGISLLKEVILEEGWPFEVSIPSSSGHQFTVGERNVRQGMGHPVSIPSSSGHQFTGCHARPPVPRRTVSIPSSSGHQFTAKLPLPFQELLSYCFNPFFIRASVYCQFSMPFPVYAIGSFQSLLHQGISLLAPRRTASGRAPCTFQSLLHQGISLLSIQYAVSCLCDRFVSIPSSSGHQFTGAASDCQRPRALHVSIPSSSGHQFTGKPIHAFCILAEKSFNPFFIRASVYCPRRMLWAVRCGWLRFNPFFIRASVY